MRPDQKRKRLYDNSPALSTAWYRLADSASKANYRRVSGLKRPTDEDLWSACQPGELLHPEHPRAGFLPDENEQQARTYLQYLLATKIVAGEAWLLGFKVGQISRSPVLAAMAFGDHTATNWKQDTFSVNGVLLGRARVQLCASAEAMGITFDRRGPKSFEVEILEEIHAADFEGHPLAADVATASEIQRRLRNRLRLSEHERGLGLSIIEKSLRIFLRIKSLSAKLYRL